MDTVSNFKDGPIDEITIYYADLSSLRLFGVVSLDNYEHLKLIPKLNFQDVHIVINVFKTILKHVNEFHISNAV